MNLSSKKLLVNNIRSIISEGLTRSHGSENIISKMASAGFGDDIYAINEHSIGISLKTKHKNIILPAISKMENLFGWFLSGFKEDFYEPVDNDVESIKKHIKFNLEEREKDGYGPDDEVLYLYFEPKFSADATKDIPDVLYHVTDKSKVDSIMLQGLRPGSNKKKTHHPDRIYLLTKTDDIKQLADELEFDEPILLTIDARGMKSGNKFYVDPNLSDGGVYTTGNIPASLIKSVDLI